MVLKDLKKLRIDLPPDIARGTIANLRFPNYVNISISGPNFDLHPTTSHLISAMRLTTQAIHRIHIYSSFSEVVVHSESWRTAKRRGDLGDDLDMENEAQEALNHVDGDEFGFYLQSQIPQVFDSQIERTLSTFSSTPTSPPFTLWIRSARNQILQTRLISILRGSRSITALRHVGYRPTDCLADLLSEPYEYEGSHRWAFPNLCELTFTMWSPEMDVFVQILRRRYGKDMSGDGGIGKNETDRPDQLPRPLERLRFVRWSDTWRKQMEEVNEIVGHDKVIWARVSYYGGSDPDTEEEEVDPTAKPGLRMASMGIRDQKHTGALEVVCSDDPAPTIAQALPRSENYPLNVELLRDTILDIQNSQLRALSAPSLEDLRVTSDSSSASGYSALPLLNEGAGRIRHVRLHNVAVDWDSGLCWSDIKTMELRYGVEARGAGPRHDELTNILRLLPSLLRLVPDGTVFDPGYPIPSIETPPMGLLERKQLCINLPPFTAELVLASIRFPSCQSFSITFDSLIQIPDRYCDHQVSYASIMHVTSTPKSNFRRAQHIEITLGRRSMGIHSTDTARVMAEEERQTILEGGGYNVDPMDVLDRDNAVYGELQGDPLERSSSDWIAEIQPNAAHMTRDRILSVLKALFVTSIQHTEYSTIPYLIEVLFESFNEDSVTKWHASSLRELNFDDWSPEPKVLRDALWRRYERTNDTAKGEAASSTLDSPATTEAI
ncbi:hypothetical protein FRB97_007788 [Tulasnella sp. 331]|nr:hypothetical protein FRB97_007788 [Tulasnella sp. 331]